MTETPEIMLIAGEASGDVLGADLITQLHKNNALVKLSAMGGPKMETAGASLVVDSRHLAVIGIGETLTHFFAIRKAFLKIKAYLKQNRPELIILIDYPGFNLRLAKFAHSLGIKVLYYVSPKIWASRYKRIHAIKKYVDHMVVFFKFEEELYLREGVPVTLVAHPLLKISQLSLEPKKICQEVGVNSEKPIIALLPGSRMGEISRLMPLICEAKKYIQQQIPEAQFVLPLASSIKLSELKKYLQDETEIKILLRPAYELLTISQAAVVASGTATLEAALTKTPLVVVYKGWEYRLVKYLITTPYIALCNIAAQRAIVRELIEYDAKPKIIAAEIIKLMKDYPYRQHIFDQLALVKNQLGQQEAASTVAQLALRMIEEEPS